VVTVITESSQKQKAGGKLITIFSVGGIRFAISVENLVEIVQFTRIETVGESRYIMGTVSLRGKKIPVLDFERFFSLGFYRDEMGLKSMILLKKNTPSSEPPATLGIVVDRIEGVEEAKSTFYPFPRAAQNKDTGIYQGFLMTGQGLAIFLDVPFLLEKTL
jgi:chemotaxis signal transduction protein